MRVEGLSHNLFTVLLLPGVPLSVIGLAALPWQARGAALRPVVLLRSITFLATSLLFPVATTWGTFLHAAGPVQVLIVLSALLALDAGIARLGRRLGWTNPVAWLGPALGIFGSALFSVVLLSGFAGGARETAAQFAELERRMAAIGHPLDATRRPGPHQLPDLAGGDQPHPVTGTSRRVAVGRPGPRPRSRRSPGRAWSSWSAASMGGGRTSSTPTCRTRRASGSWTSVPARRASADPLGDTRAFEIVCP